MPPVKCPDCEHDISDEVKSCPSCDGELRELLAKVQKQAELNRIDLEWERERQTYMVSVEGEKPLTPGRRSSAVVVLLCFVMLGVIGIVFYWTGTPSVEGGGMITAVIFVVFGILLGLWQYGRAAEYEQAKAAYRRRRKEVESRYRGELKAEDLAERRAAPCRVSGIVPPARRRSSTWAVPQASCITFAGRSA